MSGGAGGAPAPAVPAVQAAAVAPAQQVAVQGDGVGGRQQNPGGPGPIRRTMGGQWVEDRGPYGQLHRQWSALDLPNPSMIQFLDAYPTVEQAQEDAQVDRAERSSDAGDGALRDSEWDSVEEERDDVAPSAVQLSLIRSPVVPTSFITSWVSLASTASSLSDRIQQEMMVFAGDTGDDLIKQGVTTQKHEFMFRDLADKERSASEMRDMYLTKLSERLVSVEAMLREQQPARLTRAVLTMCRSVNRVLTRQVLQPKIGEDDAASERWAETREKVRVVRRAARESAYNRRVELLLAEMDHNAMLAQLDAIAAARPNTTTTVMWLKGLAYGVLQQADDLMSRLRRIPPRDKVARAMEVVREVRRKARCQCIRLVNQFVAAGGPGDHRVRISPAALAVDTQDWPLLPLLMVGHDVLSVDGVDWALPARQLSDVLRRVIRPEDVRASVDTLLASHHLTHMADKSRLKIVDAGGVDIGVVDGAVVIL